MMELEAAECSSEESPNKFTIHEDNRTDNTPAAQSELGQASKHAISSNDGFEETVPLISSKLGNIGNSRSPSAPKKLKLDQQVAYSDGKQDGSAVDTLLAKLSAQQAVLEEQKNTVGARPDDTSTPTGQDKLEIAPDAKAAIKGGTAAVGTGLINRSTAPTEVERLKQELTAAKDRILKQEQELTKTRVSNNVHEQTVSGPNTKAENIDKTISNLQEAFNATRSVSGYTHDDAKSDTSELSGVTAFNRGVNAWDHNLTASLNGNLPSGANIWSQGPRPPWMNRPAAPALPPLMVPPQQQLRSFSGSTSPILGNLPQYLGDPNQFQYGNGLRRYNNQSSRSGSSFNTARSAGWGSYGTSGEMSPLTSVSPTSWQPMGLFQAVQGYQPRPIGTPLSPTAAEFTAGNGNGPWNTTQPSASGQTYVPPMEPLNYRKLLDRSVSCNWKYIVDKIVCNNDQQASIFLQQKLKVGTAEQKYEIVEAIVAQAYPLMVNRFGNFLVQRCFEHGTPEQVVAIANAIRGNTLSLSMDAFGCHVIQKAFDAVPEEYKAIMVHELLRRIPETVIHRYACHVWQKLFELRWSDSPPQIMKYVNEALRGMWHEVALGETGSLVVQNIFENCLEEDKRPCIDEVLNSIDIVAHGQFGNWCIQHICEHGAPADRSRAIDHVLRYATEYSMDQFASKVIEKCLKIGSSDFLERYLERVCEGRPDRPRIPLIDIASDQYGNYLIQYILTHASAQHREVVASHIRKHMVSLRGSKFGSRVGLLCCNPAYATRPGPAVPASSSRFNSTISAPTNRFAAQFR